MFVALSPVSLLHLYIIFDLICLGQRSLCKCSRKTGDEANSNVLRLLDMYIPTDGVSENRSLL